MMIMEKEALKQELLNCKKWLRIVSMLLFAVIMYFVLAIICFIGLFQFVVSLFTGKSNQHLREMGKSLSRYIAAIVKYISYYSESKPFPFSEWPEGNKTPKKINKIETATEPKPEQEDNAAKQETEN